MAGTTLRMPRVNRWVTLVVAAVNLALAYGIWYSYSVFLVALLDDFGWSRAVLAGAFSVFTLVHGGINPVFGALTDRIGPRRLIILGGILVGVALASNSLVTAPWHFYLSFGVFTAFAVACCGWTPAVVLVQRLFMDRIGLALGIVSAGVGLGMVVVVPLCQFLIQVLGWRAAFQVLGVICIAWIVPATWFLVRDSLAPEERRDTAMRPGDSTPTRLPTPATVDLTLSAAMRTAPFWLMVCAIFFGSLCAQTLHVHQVAYLVDHGVSAMVGASVVGVIGLASIVAKIGGGWLSDRIEREIIYVVGIGVMILSVGALAYTGQSPSVLHAYVYAVLLGAGYSVTASLVPAMMSDRFRGRHFGAIWGLSHFGSALGSAIGPLLAGKLFDVTGAYTIPFVFAVVAALIAGVAGWAARQLRVRDQAARVAAAVAR